MLVVSIYSYLQFDTEFVLVFLRMDLYFHSLNLKDKH